MFLAASAFAQGHMDANEREVRIVEGPSIFNVTDHSARIEWVTNSAGANHVLYRVAGAVTNGNRPIIRAEERVTLWSFRIWSRAERMSGRS